MYSEVNFKKQNKPQDKPLKYYTKDLTTKDSNYTSGFGVSNVGKESDLQRSELTTFKMPQELGTLPLPTTSGRGVQSPLLSQESTRENKSCQPASENFYNRSFTIFKQQPDIGKHVQSSIGLRQGISTRNMNKTTGTNGK